MSNQRIRDTDRGLQVTQGEGVLTFHPDLPRGLRVTMRESALGTNTAMRRYTIEGRDNIRDFGEWFKGIPDGVEEGDEVEHAFSTYNGDALEHAGCVAIVRTEEGADRANFSDEIGAAIAAVQEFVGNQTPLEQRIETLAFEYPFGFMEGYSPILLATQTYDLLTLRLDDVIKHEPVPFAPARELGAWVLEGLNTIERKPTLG